MAVINRTGATLALVCIYSLVPQPEESLLESHLNWVKYLVQASPRLLLQLRLLYPQTKGTVVAFSTSCFHGPLMPLSAQTGHYSVILGEFSTIVLVSSYKGLRYVEHPARIGPIAGTGFLRLACKQLALFQATIFRHAKEMNEATPSASQPSPFEAGIYLPGGHNTDPPLTTDTVGYRLNHFMLRIRDPQRTLHFYVHLMGMRTIFTMNAGPFTMYYLGYPPTPSDRADLSAWAFRVANVRELTQTIGLLEFYHIHGTEKDKEFRVSTGNLPPNLGFGHLGFTVPDVPAAVERLRGEGVHVLKEVGDSSRGSVPLSAWEEHRGLGTGDVHPKFKEIYDQIACVADPDGYMVELVPQNMQDQWARSR